MNPLPIFFPLEATSGGGPTQTITSAASTTEKSWSMDTVDSEVQGNWVYVQALWLLVRVQIDQPASGGTAITPDDLYRIITDLQLDNDVHGPIYKSGDLNGPQLGLIAQVISNGYALPQQMRADIASSDGDTAVTLPIRLPIGHKCFVSGHQTGQLAAVLKQNARLKVTIAANTVFAALSTGAATEATISVTAYAECTQEPEARISPFWVWRRRKAPAGVSGSHLISRLGLPDLNDADKEVGRLAFLAFLSDVNGLGGSDGLDEITNVRLDAIGQKTLRLDSYFQGATPFLQSFVADTQKHNILGAAQGELYPFSRGTAINGNLNVATAMFLPFVWPGTEQYASKTLLIRKAQTDVYIDYTNTPSGQANFLSLECALPTQRGEINQLEAAGIDPTKVGLRPKVGRPMKVATDPADRMAQAAKLLGVPKKVYEV